MGSNGKSNPAFELEHNEISEAPHELAKSNLSTSTKGGKKSVVKNETRFKMLYNVDESPSWLLCVVMGIQHCLLSIGGIIGAPLIFAKFMCMKEDDVGYLGRAMVINSLIFMSGITTFLQTTFGVRLPILQGGSAAFIASILAILFLPHNECPEEALNTNLTNGTILYNDTDGSLVDGTELWQRRMREIQGALIVSSLMEMLLGLFGVTGYLMRFIGPITVAPSIALIGFSLVGVAGNYASGHWGIAALTFGLLIIFSLYMRYVKVPYPYYARGRGWKKGRTTCFNTFSVLISVALACIFCVIFTATGVFPSDPDVLGFRGRTDIKLEVLESAQWFRFPYPGQWGLPVVTGAGVVGTISATIISMVESIGDYHACARLANAPVPPTHAFNRGLMMEGFGSLICACVGTTTSTTSYTQNVAAIGITRVASRRVLQVAAVVLVLIGLIGKIGALAVVIPDPVIGGLFCVMFGMVAAVGISNLKFVDLDSSRNLFIIGFSIFMGLVVPNWMEDNPGIIQTGVTELDQIFTVLLETELFIGFFISVILDNTVPGTPEERGIVHWKASTKEDLTEAEKQKHGERVSQCYDLPFRTDCCKFSKYIPILPEFGRKRSQKDFEA